jgi:hypothetical protein
MRPQAVGRCAFVTEEIGLMRGKTMRRAWLLAAWLALAPGLARAQGWLGGSPAPASDYAPPDPVVPLPLYSTRPEAGGLYAAGSYVMYRQTNPLKDQTIAVRGFIATDTQILGPGTAGTFIGDRQEALNVQQASGPNGYQPGFKAELGYRFADGSSLSLAYTFLTETRTLAAATLVPSGLRFRDDLANTFLTAYVFNFPSDFAGPTDKVTDQFGVSLPNAVYGIWNGASAMTIDFRQRVDQYDLTYRVPAFDTDCYRLSGMVGLRHVWIWERFFWRTTDLDINGNSDPSFVGLYNNIVSNEMYGVHAGCRNECYMGHGFAWTLDLDAALLFNSVHEEAKYQLGTLTTPDAKRSLRKYTFVPEFQATLSLQWFPIEGIQVQVGYDVMAFLNTISSPRPIDFDYGSLTPAYERTFRLLDGFQAGIALIF